MNYKLALACSFCDKTGATIGERHRSKKWVLRHAVQLRGWVLKAGAVWCPGCAELLL
jgi:hypothetical protein